MSKTISICKLIKKYGILKYYLKLRHINVKGVFSQKFLLFVSYSDIINANVLRLSKYEIDVYVCVFVLMSL